MKKVIAEWLGELKLTEKKIKKTYDELSKKNMFIVENLQDSELYKEKLEEEKKEIQSSYQSLNKLIENRNKIKSAIMSFNASNTIKIDDKEYIIALALELYKGKEIVKIEELLEKKFAKIQEEKIIFIEKINIQLNIKNATTEIEIDI